MKRIIRNISLCALLAVAMGACEEEAALVQALRMTNLQSPEEVVEAAFLAKCFSTGKWTYLP